MVEVVDVVCVVGEKCVDARARANKHTKETLLIQEQNKNRNKNKNKTSKSQDTRRVCVRTHKKFTQSLSEAKKLSGMLGGRCRSACPRNHLAWRRSVEICVKAML